MIKSPFQARVRTEGGFAVLDLRGEINAFAEYALQTAFTDADALNTPGIVLNFEGVRYINSTGIALIVSLLGQARKSNRQILVYGLSDHYLEIFQITRLSDFMKIYPDEASLLAGQTVI